MKKINSFVAAAILITGFPLLIQRPQNHDIPCPPDYRRILVLATGNAPDSLLTQTMEESVAADLRGLGYTAVSAISQYGYNAFRRIREEETLKQFYQYDAVITITALKNMKDKCCNEKTLYKDFLWEYYEYMNSLPNTANCCRSVHTYYWQANLFDLDTWQQKYSVKTNTFDPAFRQGVGQQAKFVIDDMLKSKLLQKRTHVLKPF